MFIALGSPAHSNAISLADGEVGTFQHEFTHLLYNESLPAARDYARSQISIEGEVASFAYGVTLFYEAIEGLSIELSRHGLMNQLDHEIPFFRVPVPETDTPESLDYKKFRQILQNFVGRLALAETALANISDPNIQLAFRPSAARIDANGDGIYQTHERAEPIIAMITGVGVAPTQRPGFWEDLDKRIADGKTRYLVWLITRAPAFGFDGADAKWLQGYTHLLSAMVEILLAHDWEVSFDQSFHVFFPDADLPLASLNEIFTSETDYNPALLLDKALIAGIFDIASFWVHSPWEVSHPEKLIKAKEHLKSMISTSRSSWEMILSETDNLKTENVGDGNYDEWIPSPTQRNWRERQQVTQTVVDGWLAFLNTFEQILNGELLIPHYRFTQGINVGRMFEEPRALSPLLLIQGSDALPYLEDGQLADGAYMREIMALISGNFFDYFIWFN